MPRKKRRHQPPRDDAQSGPPPGPSENPREPPAPREASDQEDHDLGALVQARLDADIGIEFSLPPHLLTVTGRVALGLGLAALALTVPVEWLSWSGLLVGAVGFAVVSLWMTNALGWWIGQSLLITGGLLFVVTLGKHVTGLPAFLGPGPAGVFLGTAVCLIAIGGVALLGAQAGPAAALAREVALVKSLIRFSEELALLRLRDPDARVPVVLQCARCSVVFPFFADRIILSRASMESLEPKHLAWLDARQSRVNLEAKIEESVSCPRCGTQDDYIYAEHPEETLRQAIEKGDSLASAQDGTVPVVRVQLVVPGHEHPEPVLEKWAQLRRSIEQDPAAVGARMELARLYHWLRLGTLARQECERVLELDPENVPARTVLSSLMSDRGEEEAAQRFILDATMQVLGSDGPPRLEDHADLLCTLLRHHRGWSDLWRRR